MAALEALSEGSRAQTLRLLGTRAALVLLLSATVFVALLFGIALALSAFLSHRMRARVGEPRVFVTEVRLREEAYRAEFGEYLALDWSDVAIPGPAPGSFGGGPRWERLGALPDARVRFRYRVLTGTPGHPAVPGIGLDENDFGCVIQAEGDLDGDGDTMAVEGYCGSEHLYLSRGVGGPPLTEGWE